MTTLETRHFVASASDVASIAAAVFSADQQSIEGRTTYMKAMVATVQAELGSKPRLRNGTAPKLSTEDTALHLKAFEAVATRFLDAVTEAALKANPDAKGLGLASMTGFARSSASTLRSYIRANNDIRALAAGSVSKRALAVPRTRRRLTADALKRRLERVKDDVLAITKNLMALNKADAQAALAPLIGALVKAAGMADKPARDANTAEAERRPWHTKTGVFVPIDLSVERQRRAA